jgi:hypothetical protein
MTKHFLCSGFGLVSSPTFPKIEAEAASSANFPMLIRQRIEDRN